MAINFNGVRIIGCAPSGGGSPSNNITTFETVTGDSYTKFLAHFDGADGSTSFTDDSSSPLTSATFAGAAAIKTTQSKFGGSSLYLNGVGTSYLRIANTSNKVNFDGDFTIEGWYYFNTIASWVGLFSVAKDGDYQGPVIFLHNGQISFIGNTALGHPWEYWFATTGVSITTGSWVHIAVVGRYQNSIKIYVNGTERASNAYSTRLVVKADSYIWPGHYEYYAPVSSFVPNSINGYVDEMRYSNYARYTANFTPSASAFETGVVTYPTAVLGKMAKDSNGFLYECTDASIPTWRRYTLG